jgi:ABC-type glycerol-3-phosphate transport system substrate-binding protein
MTGPIRLVAIAGILVLTATAAACGGGNQTSSKSTASPVTLKIEDFSPEQATFHSQVAAEYHRLNPNVTIEWQSIAQAQYNQTLPLAFQSQQSPDVFYWTAGGTNTMSQLLANGWIRPLSPDGKVDSSWTKRWPAGLFVNGINMKGGKVYGFPWQDTKYWGPGYMYLNKAVFQSAGLDPSKPPATWSELQQTCATIKAMTKAYCIAAPMKDVDWQRTWFAMASGSLTDLFFDYRTGQYDLGEPQMLQVFNYLQGLYRAGLLAPGVNDKGFSRQQFAAGQAGIYMDGPWMISVWNQLGFHSDGYTVAPHPVPDGGATGALSMRDNQNAYWVSAQTKHSAEVWAFLQWMTEPAGFFVQNFLKNSFATLAFADNKTFLTDPAWKAVFKIAETKNYRVATPEPVLKCPALAQSKAEADANRLHPNWEYEVMVSALVNNKDLAPMAKQVAAGRQDVLQSELQKEAGTGLKVSLDCYTFANWSYTQSYNPNGYPKS